MKAAGFFMASFVIRDHQQLFINFNRLTVIGNGWFAFGKIGEVSTPTQA